MATFRIALVLVCLMTVGAAKTCPDGEGSDGDASCDADQDSSILLQAKLEIVGVDSVSGMAHEVTLEESGVAQTLLSPRTVKACTGKDYAACGAASDCSWDGSECASGCGTFSSESSCPSDYCVWYGKKVSLNKAKHCGDKLDFINLGGDTSTNFNGASSQNAMVGGGRSPLGGLRPQLSTMQRSTDGTTWTACAGTTDCWHGADSGASNRAWDDLEVTLDSSYTKASVDVLIDCEWDGNIEVHYRNAGLSNGDLALWYNTDKVIIGNGVAGGWDSRRRYADKWKKTIAFTKNDAFPVLRMELSKTSSAAASAKVYLYIMNVPVWFEKCMDTKATHGQCLEDFVGGSDPLRSDHSLQYDCITSAGSPSYTIDGCSAWYQCLTPLSRNIIVAVIDAFDPVAATLLQQNSTSTWTSGTGGCSDSTSTKMCADPSQIDVESFDCTCYDHVIDSSGATPVLRSQAEIRAVACPAAQSHICCSWKTANCPAYPGALLQTDEAVTHHEKTMQHRSKQAALAEAGSLDESLSGKRSCA